MPRLTSPRRAFTLVELLISLSILAVVGTLVVNITLGQERFYQRANEKMNVRRELRAAMQLVPSDLRTIASAGGDLTTFGQHSLTFRGIVGVSVACARPAANALDLPPTNLARNTLTNWTEPPIAGDTAWVFNDSLSSGAEDDVWVPLTITGATLLPSACAGSPLLDPVLDVGKTGLRLTVWPTLPDSVVAGAAIRFTRSLRYNLEQQPSGRWYLMRTQYRDGAWQAATPVSGPYAPPGIGNSGGLRFAFFDSLGRAVADPTQGRQVARIDLVMEAEGAVSSGSSSGGSLRNTDSLAFRIALRNRQ